MVVDNVGVRELDLSIVIITFNEEKNIQECLRSLPKGAEVVVLDSGSSDRTRSLCEAEGVHFLERPFTNYADQKNFAISASLRSWVLSIDADERLSPELRDGVVAAVTAKDGPASFRLRRQLCFMGRMMRYGRTVDHPIRLFRRDAGEFRSSIHERFQLREETSAVGSLPGVLLHFSYEDLSAYFETFNRFTSLVADNHMKSGRRDPSLVLHLMRPWFEFVSRYFFKLGFLDGYPGYTYALLSSMYTYVKYAKLREIKAKRR
jgi:glycosyltransferase involved in cell wall biosynthesis